jgi:Lar family restriction alleviation protein
MTDTTKPATPELLPCPFCGSTNLTTEDARDFMACLDCHAEGPARMGQGSTAAIEAWNRRPAATPAATDERELTDDDIERVLAQTMDKVASSHGMHAMHLNADITNHKTLRNAFARAIVQAARAQLAAPPVAQLDPPQWQHGGGYGDFVYDVRRQIFLNIRASGLALEDRQRLADDIAAKLNASAPASQAGRDVQDDPLPLAPECSPCAADGPGSLCCGTGECWLCPLRSKAVEAGRDALDAECHGLDTAERVRFYEHDFYPLSNFSAFNLRLHGFDYPTSEHAYHAEKFRNFRGDIADLIARAPSAHEAFKIAERYRRNRIPEWDEIKVSVMREILRAKAAQHEYVRRKLLATGDRELVEDSWRDDFWGWGPNCDGQNMLGKLWMEVRAELRAALAGTPGAPMEQQP